MIYFDRDPSMRPRRDHDRHVSSISRDECSADCTDLDEAFGELLREPTARRIQVSSQYPIGGGTSRISSALKHRMVVELDGAVNIWILRRRNMRRRR
jgi:hypothetical protein